MLVLLVVSWLLIGVGAAWIGKVLSSDLPGWFGLALFGSPGRLLGEWWPWAFRGPFPPGLFRGVIGAVAGVMLRGAAEEIRSTGPGLAV